MPRKKLRNHFVVDDAGTIAPPWIIPRNTSQSIINNRMPAKMFITKAVMFTVICSA